MKNSLQDRAAALTTDQPPSRSGLPSHPRFLHELAISETENQLLIDGLDQLHVFTGEAARSLLVPLISLMDGSRSLEQLGTALPGFGSKEVADAISSLDQWGLLEDGATFAATELEETNETLAFFRRNVGAGRVNRSGREAYERIRNSEILLVASRPFCKHAETLKAQLKESGVQRILCLDMASLKSYEPSASPRSLLVSLSVGSEDRDRHETLDDWCVDHNCSWLRAVLNESSGYADVGPLFQGSASTCYRCFANLHSPEPPSDVRTDGINALILIGLLAIEIIYMLSKLGPQVAARDFQRYSLPNWRLKRLGLTRIPGCLRCRPEKPDGDPTINAAVIFEDYIGLQSAPAAVFRKRQVPTGAINELSPQVSTFQSCVHYPLDRLPHDAVQTVRTNSHTSQSALTIEELSLILMTTAGIRDFAPGARNVKRWAATGGNLGSVELFLAVQSVAGLPDGLYFYQPFQHKLALFQQHRSGQSVTDLMHRILPECPDVDLPSVLLFFTGAFNRLAKKYGTFGYRLIHLDAGVAFSQTQQVAKSLGLFATLLERWPDDVIEQRLNLDSTEQPCTAVVTLARREIPGLKLTRSGVNSGNPQAFRPIQAYRDHALADVLKILLAEGRLMESSLPLPAPAPVPPRLVDHPQSAWYLSLPAPSASRREISDVLRQRNTIRNFTNHPISLESLSAMLHCADEGDLHDFSAENDAQSPLKFQILAMSIDGLAPGIYEYDRRRQSLTVFNPVLGRNELQQLLVQDQFASAPMVVWISGNLAASCIRHGAFGHRQLLFRAGLAANRLWMAALSWNIGGAITAGLIPGSARRHLGLDGYTRASLVAFAAGHPSTFRVTERARAGRATAQEEAEDHDANHE